jgi:hypothetical protein
METTDRQTHPEPLLDAAEAEHVIDLAIQGVTVPDPESLSRLTMLCREWERDSPRLALAQPVLPSLRTKLLLLDRVLRITRANLDVLGIGPVDPSAIPNYGRFSRQ